MDHTRETVVITPRSVSREGHPALAAITDAGYELLFPSPGRQPEEGELIAAMDRCVGYLAGVEPVTAAVLAAAPKLRVISRNGVGRDNVDIDAAREHGIQVELALGANARGVAELAFGHLLCAARGIPSADQSLKTEKWERTKGIELEGRTLAVIGYGAIGRIVAQLGQAFGMNVLVHDPFLQEGFIPPLGVELSAFHAALERADAISLHCPPEKDRYLIGPGEISRMKAGAILVNTARDGLVDPDAAAAALASGHLRSLTVDAFSKEPPESYDFVRTPGVIATPHIGGFTEESVDRAIGIAVDNLLRVLKDPV